MGVPKFYRWTSERYPCLSEVINESQIPEFDNLYLDMNGIIHNCSHPNDDDVTFRITEEEIFVNIFAYIENLYNLIRPQKVFFMAVDGVAPRAKMNQQRARRFMSARTAQQQLKKALEKGEAVPDGERFDSNCITPGTYFMTRLHERLDTWIRKKSANDPRWHGRTVILSGHNCPGEGEHKIMDYIRTQRAKPDYDPNTRHCMYGLDADLIMLGIVSHEPHFSLLREEVTFNTRPRKNDKKQKPQRTDSAEKKFHLLHLSLLREYLAWEFSSVKEKLPFEYDMERIVDDWILMGLLVGNDFLPHLPNIHIHDDALPLLYATYKKVLPTLDGYLHEGGYLKLHRFEKFLKQLAVNDKDSFMEKAEDEQFLESKRIRPAEEEEKMVAFESSDIEDEQGDEKEEEEEDTDGSHDAAFVSDDEEDEEDRNFGSTEEEETESSPDDFLEQEFNDELATLALSALDDKDFANNVEACWTRTLNNSFKRHKKAYYSDKLRYKNISKTELRAQAEGYVRAIQWNLHYYYHGCVSWSWYYPHHYAPFISDVVDFADMKIEFELSEPFRPFEQLLAVLPEASSNCLPKPLQELMTADATRSQIHDFFPANFETDLNGKRNDWEAVVLIPFIDEKRLLEAIREKERHLTAEETNRNSHGPHIQCVSSKQANGQWSVARTLLDQALFRIPKESVKWGLLPNVKMDVYFPGFPTMKHLSHVGELRHANCNVFGMASRKESMVLRVGDASADKDVVEWGAELCDEEVCVDWPILKLSLVESIWGDDKVVCRKEDEIIVRDMSEEEKKQWAAHSNHIVDNLLTRYAVEVAGRKDAKGKHVRPALVWVRKFTGLVYETVEGKDGLPPVLKAVKQWSSPNSVVPVLLPLVVKDVLLENSRLLADLPVRQAYPLQSVVWLTNPKVDLFGMPGMVDGYSNENTSNCRINVVGMISPNKVDKLEALRKKQEQKSLRWMGGFECARQVGCDNRLFARITGTIFLWNEPRERVEKGQQLSSDSKINCGLSLKFSRRDLCVADYTDRVDFVNNRGISNKTWFYSNLTCRLVSEYKKKFPEVFRYLEATTVQVMDDVYYTEDIWSNETKRAERFAELKEFLDSLPSRDAEQFKCGTKYADCNLIAEVEKVTAETEKAVRTMSRYSFPASQMFRYELYDGKVHVDAEADFQILDRVAVMSTHTKVPKTVQGTVVGLHDDKVDVLFDRAFDGGSKVRGSTLAAAYRVPQSALFNVTFGLVRKGADNKKQEQKMMDGAYVQLPPKSAKKAEPSTSKPSTSSSASSNSQARPKSTVNKDKPVEKWTLAKRKDESAEGLTDSLNKLLNIKPTASTSSSSSQGKSVSLMELLGGGGSGGNNKNNAKKSAKNLEGSKTLEEIEAVKKPKKKGSILEQLSEAQQKKKTVKKEVKKEVQKEVQEVEQKIQQVPNVVQQNPQVPFGMPPPSFVVAHPNFGMPPPMPAGFPMGMVPIGMPPNQQPFDGKRANPSLIDFKPSTVSRRQNHRNPHAPKVTMITKPAVSPPPEHKTAAPEESSSSTTSTSTKKPRKKKQSRLAVQFAKPTESN